MKLYLQLFLVAALGYGMVASLILSNLMIGTLFGVSIGIVLAAIFGTLQHQAFEGKKQDADRSVHQARDIELDLPYVEAYRLCLEALTSLGRVSLKHTNHLEGVIEARTSLNWQTYGERISFYLTRLDSHTTQVHIESHPRIKVALTDFGRNLHNVNQLSVFLRAHSASDALAIKTHTVFQTPDENEDDYESERAVFQAVWK
jgi:hypothetical protein